MTDFPPDVRQKPVAQPSGGTAEQRGLFPHYKAHPVSYLDVEMRDLFWAPRQQTTRKTSIDWISRAHDAAGGLAELRRNPELYQARTRLGEMEHVKFIEAMAAAVGVKPDSSIVALIDAWAEPLIDAQAADGYLAEGFPLGLSRPANRWEVCRGWVSHEDYLIGHYIEAAIGYREATGRTELFDSAVRAADNMASELLDGETPYTSGHPEIEQALMRLYGSTGETRYLRLCRWLLDQRGRHDGRATYGRRSQDHMPVVEQRTIAGHAVCAAYLFNGATEYVGATGDEDYREAVLTVWDDLVEHKMYLHGGSGNISSRDEAYLPVPCDIQPDDCYGESCAAIANFRWAHSLFALTGDASYIDTAEKIMYNVFPASLSLKGDSSFYTNVGQTGVPAVARGALQLTTGERRREVRFEDLALSCCPPNIVKLTNTVGGYFYSIDEAGIYVKHYASSSAQIPFSDGVEIRQMTDYPWSEEISLKVNLPSPRSFLIRLRIPEWADGSSVCVNGEPLDLSADSGWLTLERDWHPSDVIDLRLPMRVERVTMPPRFVGYANRASLRRGPVVYCLEEADADFSPAAEDDWMFESSNLNFAYIPEDEVFTPRWLPDFLGGVVVLEGDLRQIDLKGDEHHVSAMFVPYSVWGNREPSEMRIWLGAHREPVHLFLFQQMGWTLGTTDWD